MVKDVRLPNEEFSRRRDSLFAVLDSFGLSPESSPWVSYSVHSLVRMAVTGKVSDLRAIKAGPERKKLVEAGAAAKNLAKKIHALSPEVLNEITFACFAVVPEGLTRKVGAEQRGRVVSDIYESPDERDIEDFWMSFWETAGKLDQVIDQIVPEVNRRIDAAPNAGRRDLISVEVVHQLRGIWEEALNRGAAPLSITDAGEFADFLAEAFKALGLGNNPRAAVDSWREYCLEYPDGWHW